MSTVSLVGVGFAYADRTPILSEVDARFELGFTALVGENGAGKSTLLSLLAGALSPTEGDVRVEPAESLITLCEQTADAPSEAVLAFVEADDRDSVRLRGALALAGATVDRWSTLSHGERKRLAIGAALARSPDVLLLDEPTNHLDARARALLLRTLGRYRGTCIFVSHDRAFIEGLADRTAWLAKGSLDLYDGGCAHAERVRATEARARRRTRTALRQEERRVAGSLDAERRRQKAAERNVSATRRIKGKRDSDGRSVNRKARAAKAEAAHARSARSLASRHGRSGEALEATRVERELGGALFVDFAPARRGRLASVVLPELCIAGRRLLRGPLSLVVESQSRIRIDGANGAGKTTLLSALTEALGEERTLYLPQELDEPARRGCLARLRRLPNAERGRVLRIVAALGSAPERILHTELPSPGEAKKLILAEGLGRGVASLVLDEPTNHLDLPSIVRLEAALAAYPGALILVTHDAWFGERLTDEVWTLSGGALSRRSALESRAPREPFGP